MKEDKEEVPWYALIYFVAIIIFFFFAFMITTSHERVLEAIEAGEKIKIGNKKYVCGATRDKLGN